RVNVSPCRLHARDQLLCLRGSVVVAHVISSKARGLKPLGHQRRPRPLGGGRRPLPLLTRLRLQGFGPGGDLRESSVDVALVERARQVWFASLDQHGRQAGAQARQRPLQHIALCSWVQWHIAVVLGPGIVVMRLTLKAIKSEHFVLLVIRTTKHMNTDALIILQMAVLDAKAEYSGRDVGRLCWV